jgi:hypothetical protein
MKTILNILILASLLFAEVSYAQLKVSVPISRMLSSPYGSGSYTYSSGIVATAQIITTCTCTPGSPTGYNGTSASANLGGTYSGHTLAAYTGDTSKGMLTSMQTATRAFNGTSDGTITRPGTGSGNLTGALGFWVHFSDSILVDNILTLDIDGTSGGSPNREWVSVFGYNTKDTSSPVIFTGTGGTRTTNAGMITLTNVWGTTVSTLVSGIPTSFLPTASNVQVWRSTFSGPAGTGDVNPDDTTNQVLFTPVGGRMITDLFILMGIFDDNSGLVTLQAAAVGPIVAQVPVPLPLHLTSFIGQSINEGLLLEWFTAEEDGNEIFEIQRSYDGSEFTTIHRIAATRNTNHYKYLDQYCVSGDAFYRIKTLYTSGQFNYSKIIRLYTYGKMISVYLYPNPVNNLLNFDIPEEYGESCIEVYSITGTKMLSQNYKFREKAVLDCTSLYAGTYLVKVSGINKQSKTLVVYKK